MKLNKKNPLLLAFAALVGFTFAITVPSASGDTVTFNTAETTTWTCPEGVHWIQVECWGGGGAGGAGSKITNTGTNTSQNGGGGGGGAYARRAAVPVTPGQAYTITIPAAAVSGTNGTTTNGGGRVDGGTVTFVGDGGVAVTAAGGTGGANAYTNVNSTIGVGGGAGGATVASAGDFTFAGGTGSGGNTGATNVSGSGGGGAGNASAGGAGLTSTTSPYVGAGAGGTEGGGAGGVGRMGNPPTSGNTNEGAGTPGATPGGGGGGAKNQGISSWLGGTGGLGQIVITYEGPSGTIAKANNPDNLNLATSWQGGVAPAATERAKWDGTVTAANTTVLGADVTWAGMQVANPGGLVTIDAGNTLTLGGALVDIDLTSATQDLTLNCNLALGAENVWSVATSRTLTLGGAVSGSALVAKQGAGTAVLAAANTYTGATNVYGGTLNITGSLTGLPTSSKLNVKPDSGSAVVNYSGGDSTLFAVTGATVPGTASVFNMTAGTLTITPGTTTGTQSVVGAGNTPALGAGAYGYYNITGGTLRDLNRFTVTSQSTASATNGTGTGVQTGVVFVGGTGTIDQTNGEWWLNYSLGQFTVADSGKIDRTGSTSPFGIFMNHAAGVTGGGYGVLNLAGANAQVLTGTQPIRFGNSTTAGQGEGQSGFVNIAAGTLSVGANANTSLPAAPAVINNAYFNFAGGTVKATAPLSGWIPVSNASINFNSNLFGPIDNSAVAGAPANFTGGLTVDSNGFDITIANPLQAPGGVGVTQANLSVSGGSGYVGAPAVIFSSTDVVAGGTPAAGYALISGGAVTGIVITVPGTYLPGTTPTVTLIGGGGTGASVTATALNTPNSGGGLTKTGTGRLTLTGANTYSGATTVNAGVLAVSGSGTLAATGGLTVGNGAGFNFLPATVGTNLDVATLNLSDGGSIGLAWDATSSNRITAAGAATVGTGIGVGINLTGTPTLATPYTILAAASGLDTGSYVLLNATDYYATISKSPTAVTVTATTSATPLTAAYWKGGYPGFSGVWAVSNGQSGGTGLSNWTRDPAGFVNTALVPGPATDVFLSASGAGGATQNAMTLGANMEINSLTVNDAGSPNSNPVTLLGTDGATLTLAAAAGTGITVNAGSGAVTVAANIALGSDQTWTNHGTNPLTVSGTVSGSFGLTKAGTGLLNITGAAAVTSATVDAGTLYMGAQTGASTTTTLGAASAVTLNGTGNLTIRRTNTGAVDLIGAIDGTGSLTLLGDNANTILSGDFSLNNASSYSGGTTIIGARAAPTLGTAFGTGPVTVGASGGIFVNAATQSFTNDFIIGGQGWNEPSGFLGALRMNGTTISGTITLTADSRITGSGSSTLSGKISGGFGLDFFEDTAIGTISLAGDNDYTGVTIVNSMGSGSTFPNLTVSSNTALGSTTGGTIVYGTGTSGNGAQLTLADAITVTDETLTLDATANNYRASLITAGTATWDGNVIVAGTGGLVGFNTSGAASNLTVGSSDADTITGTNSLMLRGTGIGTVNSTLNQGTAGLFKTDNGTWTITSNNNGFTGTPTIAAGILSVSTIADAGVNSALGAGTTIALGQNSSTVGTLQFTGTSGGSSNRALTMNNGTGGGSGVIENAVAGQTLTLSGALTAATPASASSLTLTGAGDGVLSGGIVDAPLLALGKNGGGSWTLSGPITYRGATNVTDGTLNFSAASVFDSATSVGTFTVNGATAVANLAGTYKVASGNGNAYFEIKGGGTLNFNGDATLGDGATGAGVRIGEGSAGTMTMTGGTLTANLNASSNFVVGRSAGGNGTVNLSGGTLTVTGTGGIQIANTAGNTGVLNVSGTGQLVMSSTGAVTMGPGTSTINLNTGGTFTLGSALSASGTSAINFDGGTLKASANITIPATLTTANLKDGGAIFDTNGNTITVNVPLLNFSGATTDSLTKNGTGTLTLAGANTYTGATTVNAGTLLVNSPGSLAASSAVTVNDSATLGGTGTIGGNVTVAAAANLAPGASAGTLTISGALDLSALAGGAGTLAFELDALAGTNDRIVAGTLAIGSGTLGFGDFVFTNLGGLEAGTYKLITSGGLTGTLDAANLTGKIGSFDATLQLNGNDVEIVVSSTNAYATWALAKGLDVSNNAKSADPDGDGRNNLAEFAFDGNPLAGANDGKVVGKVATVSAAKVMTLTLPVRTGAVFAADSGDQLSALIDGIYYRIEGDEALSPFADAITEVTTGDETAIQAGLPALSTGWTYRTFRAPGTVSTVPKAFLRAKISETP